MAIRQETDVNVVFNMNSRHKDGLELVGVLTISRNVDENNKTLDAFLKAKGLRRADVAISTSILWEMYE